MKKLDEHVGTNSIWNTITPLSYAKTLPFYVIEAGMFFSDSEYLIEREYHDSFLILYTLEGEGTIVTKNSINTLTKEHCIIIDCHQYHKYYTSNDIWNFLWVHVNGSSCQDFFHTLYPNDIFPLFTEKNSLIDDVLRSFVFSSSEQTITTSLDQSLQIHNVMNKLIKLALIKEQESQKRAYDEDIKVILEYIEQNFSQQLTIDDMLSKIHISKYHFIRLFKRTMGVAPYHYLNAYRINYGKTLLRTTSLPISSIAEACGFLDTSNFISQFKKMTGQKPTEYRKNFV